MIKNKQLFLGFLFLFNLFLLGNLLNNNESSNYGNQSQDKDDIEALNDFDQLENADSDVNYKENLFTQVYDDFESLNGINDWTESGSGSLNLQQNYFPSDKEMRMQSVQDSSGTLRATYNSMPQDFFAGSISFDYDFGGQSGVSKTLYLECLNYDTSNWDTLEQVTTTGTESGSINTNFEGEIYENVRLRFEYDNPGENYAWVDIDDFQLDVYEFCWTETGGENINPTSDQGIDLFIAPNFINYWSEFRVDNVTLKYRVENSDLSNPDGTITSGKIANNFTFTIPESDYYESDTIYYQIWINNDARDTYRYTPVKNFKCVTDTTNPSVSITGGNYTGSINYYNDISIICSINDNYELFDAVLYFDNNSIPDINSKHIKSQYGSSIPEGGGSFEFVIPKELVSSKNQIYFIINGTDYGGNSDLTSHEIINIGDDIEPNILFQSDNSAGGIIESNKSLQIQYDITEPERGIGLDNATLYVKISNSAPSNGGDYNRDPIFMDLSGNGGDINFTIPKEYYSYGEKIYYWVNATDNAYNMNSTLLVYKERILTDNTYPNVAFDSLNKDPCSYNVHKTLTFNITEPPGGVGIDSDSLALYYEIGDPNLNSPQKKNFTITQYGGEKSVTIDDLTYSYGQTVYYQINVSDLLGLKYISPIYNFNITDLVNPQYSENLTENTNGWLVNDVKHLTFEVGDPDYEDNFHSSGIKSMHLYYSSNQVPTTSLYDGMHLSPFETLVKANKTYSFNISLSEFIDLPEIYYIINITDYAGNSYISSPQSFQVYDKAYNPNSIVEPANVIPSASFEVSFNTYFFCDMYYIIDSGAPSATYIDITSFSKEFDLEEGEHNITFIYADGLSSYQLLVEIDLTPPDQITSLDFKLYGSEVIAVYWNEPDNADDETIYRLYRSTSSDFELNDKNFIIEMKSGDELNYEDTDVDPGTTYYYKVIAIDRVGNISEESVAIEVKVPQSLVTLIIAFIAIGASVGIGGTIAYRKITSKKREKIFSQVDLSELDDKYDMKFEATPKELKGPQWTEIKTKADPKPIIEDGFEFSEGGTDVLPLVNYWPQKMGKLLSLAAEFELMGNNAEAIKTYNIILRMAKRDENFKLVKRYKDKIITIYQEA